MSDRVDEKGAAYAGSQLQTQLYVNKRTKQLDDVIRGEFSDLADASFDWRSPLANEGCAEYWDKAFLQHVDLLQHAAELKAFWPAGGPHWDALAVVNRSGSDRPGVVLGEGKSYPGELYSSGCQAKPQSMSRTLIEKSLGWTQAQLGVTTKTPAVWAGRSTRTPTASPTSTGCARWACAPGSCTCCSLTTASVRPARPNGRPRSRRPTTSSD